MSHNSVHNVNPTDAAAIATLRASVHSAAEQSDRERLGQLLTVIATAGAEAASLLSALKKPEASDTPDRGLSVAEAAQRLGVSVHWLYRNAERTNASFRLGGRRLFSERKLSKFIENRAGK